MKKNFLNCQNDYNSNGKFYGWALVFVFLGLMTIDQFVLAIPYENVVFPLLAIAAATMTFSQNLVLIAVYSVIYELSCISWFPYDLYNVRWWLLTVFIGYFSVYAIYKLIFAKKKSRGVITLSLTASLGELLYFWVSVVATCLIWKIPFSQYALSDLPFELLGSAVTFICAAPLVYVYNNFKKFFDFRIGNKI